jgi:hypothetical protein
LLEGWYIEDDDYAYWSQCVQAKEQQRTQYLANKCFEFPSHFFSILTSKGREYEKEKDRWIEIKVMINSSTSLDDK